MEEAKLSGKEMLLLLVGRFSCVGLCATPQKDAHQAPASLGLSSQEDWSGLHFLLQCMHACLVASVMSDSVRLYGQQPTRLLCPRNSPGKNTGVGCRFFLHFKP